jgi:hypothetical protein
LQNIDVDLNTKNPEHGSIVECNDAAVNASLNAKE